MPTFGRACELSENYCSNQSKLLLEALYGKRTNRMCAFDHDDRKSQGVSCRRQLLQRTVTTTAMEIEKGCQ